AVQHFPTPSTLEDETMAIRNFTRHRADLDEAILLRSFDNLERALREQTTDQPVNWAKQLADALGDVEAALGTHQRTLDASDSPTEEEEHHTNVPATIDRRWDKLRLAMQDMIGRAEGLRQRTEGVVQGRTSRNQGCAVVELDQEIAQ